MQQSISKSLIFLLAAVFAMTPYAIDCYLPAIPSIAADFNVNTAMISVTVSMYIFGMAVGQLIGGPLSDKYGRQPVMFAGLVMFGVCSLMLAIADSLSYFWFLRCLQSIGGGIAVVGVPATIRDNSEGKEAAKLFSLVMLIMMIAPSIAPAMGTLIMTTTSWHWIFISSAMFAIFVAIMSFFIMPKPKANINSIPSGGFMSVLKYKPARGYLIAVAFSYAVLITFITNAPFAYLVKFGISEALFSALFIGNVIGVVTVNRINAYFLNRYEAARMLVVFLCLQLFGGGILFASLFFMPDNLWFAAAGFITCMAATGGTMSNASACFLKFFAKNAGTASALMGATQFSVGALISGLTALFLHDSLWPMILVMFSCAAFALLSTMKTNHYHQSQQLVD
ncbi:multidrug effflux MFS transporter [Shewanella intestini]|uniref:Bcr/CflA family efflux transporter n=1 Tax=Shewanella intestini TaxID=2017544 RepID=A0ABS5I4C4_9GAMM|nr:MULTISPECIES: multidrug effflux MFS transporter [Shewanella]MBR9728877.1 multidrug effflux MFS transporter [Shewanella intestini]MRG37057.1 Bcr/CflA family efflux MFS transporter [Shewanella sp. XMDDZSB0408]